jgi:hypothetical protein
LTEEDHSAQATADPPLDEPTGADTVAPETIPVLAVDPSDTAVDDGEPPWSYVYAVGRIEARFPSLGVEKEYAQATGRTPSTDGLTDRQALHRVLGEAENRYLARMLCWVFSVSGLDTYILRPRDSADLRLFVDSIRSEPDPTDLDVIIGMRGPLATPEMCNGLMVPIVAVDLIYAFKRDELLGSIPRPENIKVQQFRAVASELFDRVLQLADNAGATDEHRALNYLAVRYPAIYARAAQAYADDFALTAVEVRPAPVGGARKVVEVVLAFTNRTTDFTERWCVRCDVTEEFPFLVSKLGPCL